jgi:hypothetical protein
MRDETTAMTTHAAYILCHHHAIRHEKTTNEYSVEILKKTHQAFETDRVRAVLTHKIAKSDDCYIMFVCLSVRMEQLGSH